MSDKQKIAHEVSLTKEETQKLADTINVLYEFMDFTDKVIRPIDEMACKAIEDIICMSMVSLGRKYGLDYCESDMAKVDKTKEQEIDKIMEEIKGE